MRLILATILLLATVNVVLSNTCSWSGDPHFISFDGSAYSFYGYGVFVIVQNQYVNVQAQFLRCNGGGVTCTRSVVAQFIDPVYTNTSLILKWGNFQAMPAWAATSVYPASGASPDTTDPVIIQQQNLDGTVTSLSLNVTQLAKAQLFLNGMYLISYTSSTLNVVQQKRKIDPSSVSSWSNLIQFYYAKYYSVAVTLPKAAAFTSATATEGVCGTYDNNPRDDLMMPNGTVTTNVNTFGLSWAVTRSSAVRPLMKGFIHQTLGQNRILDDPVDPVVPDDTTQAALNQVNFGTMDDVNTAQQACASLNTANSQQAYQNCLYDYAAVASDPNYDPTVLMAISSSNLAAAQLAATAESTDTSSSGLSAGVIAAIVVGVVAGVAMLTIGILYVRLRQTRRQLSQALVLAQGSNNIPTSSGDIRLQDNL